MTGRSSLAFSALSPLLFASLAFVPAAQAGPPDLAYYLPTSDSANATTYDPDVPTPADVFGFQPGEWHVRHDQLVDYMDALAEASDRVAIRDTGRTHEGRRLVVLTITSLENHARLDEIQKQHMALSDPSSNAPQDVADMPAVAYLGYSVHGNEASGTNAAPLVAYYLAAGRGEEVERTLKDVVVLLDPSFNPDGLARFAHWANTNRGRVLTADPNHREHNEPWPGGRTNHYLFDLNRDWLLVQHPETGARLSTFHAWRPNVLTDHHEMGTDATFFFQPGVDSRKNPLTPQRNVELTQALAEHHAEALDEIGSLYYTRESFDDFYYGKGSTYPDIQGAVGILFEQASSRGHMQESENGPDDGVLTFPFGVRNQVVSSLSTLRGVVANREDLLEYQRDFYRDAAKEAAETVSNSGLAGWVVDDGGDPQRLKHMADVLHAHGIETRALGDSVAMGGRTFEPSTSMVVPMRQRQSRLANAIFETRTEFEDDTFYDVSTWTMPYAFGLPYAELKTSEAVGDAWSAEGETAVFDADPGAVAFAVEWHHYAAPSALNRLQRAGVDVRAAALPLQAETPDGVRDFEPGTLFVHVGLGPNSFQDVDKSVVLDALGRVAADDGIEPIPILGGLTPSGPDLGSPNVRPLDAPKVAILSGSGTSSYEVGQAWHLLDHRFGVETTLLDQGDAERADLSRYSHLVMVHGRGGGPSEDLAERIRGWVQDGGVLVAIKGGAAWATENVLSSGDDDGSGDNGNGNHEDPPERKPYADFDRDFAKGLIGGTIFESRLDLTHPLAFGYREEMLPVFKNSRVMLERGDSPYTTVAAFTDEPLLSGYVSDENADDLAGTPAVIAERLGRGAVVRLAIDPNFRAIWYGTNRLFLNSLFLTDLLDRRPNEEPREEMEMTVEMEGH